MARRLRPGSHRHRARATLLLLLVLPLAWSCQRDETERRAVFEEAQRTQYEIAQGAVVQDLRAPSDTGRLVYDSAVSLRERAAAAAGTEQVWAPFGIAEPDTVAPARRSQ